MFIFSAVFALVLVAAAHSSEVERLQSKVTYLHKKIAHLEREQVSVKRLEERLSQLESKTPDFYSCDSAPCLNGGSCVDTGVEGGFLCVCQPSFFGVQCDETLLDYSFAAGIVGFPLNLTQFGTLRFDDVLFNPGNAYDPSTGVYTAPYTGQYEFVIQKRSNENMGDFQLKINNVAYMSTAEGDGFAVAMQTAASTLPAFLNAGDEVTVMNHLSTQMWGSDAIHGHESWFSGKLLYIARQ